MKVIDTAGDPTHQPSIPVSQIIGGARMLKERILVTAEEFLAIRDQIGNIEFFGFIQIFRQLDELDQVAPGDDLFNFDSAQVIR